MSRKISRIFLKVVLRSNTLALSTNPAASESREAVVNIPHRDVKLPN